MSHFKLLAAAVAAVTLSACGGDGGDVSSSSSSSSSSSTGATGSINLNTDLPKEMRISEDGERLETGGFYMSKFYDESKVVELTLEQLQQQERDSGNPNVR